MLSQVKIKKLNPKATVPFFATSQAAGADLTACLDSALTINPHETVKVPLGFATEFNGGNAALILPRSGISLKKGLAPVNAPGLIDADYRGEWAILLHNYSDTVQTIEENERIAQVVFVEIDSPVFEEVEELTDTLRGEGGFGSTGK